MKVSIVGASGYGGGELLRLLLDHPDVEVHQVTSERNAGKPVTRVHPNLRKRTSLDFCMVKDLEKVDLLFMSLPHTQSMQRFNDLSGLAERIIDLSADFRLKDPAVYAKWYGIEHAHPDKLSEFVYGNVELHREEMKKARYISGAGCNATATILPLYPLFKLGVIDTALPVIAEAKCGSSEGGNAVSEGSHHPERSGCVRSYKPTGHRHIAEMEQELGHKIHFSATSIEMVRGILVTAHLFVKPEITEKEIWKCLSPGLRPGALHPDRQGETGDLPFPGAQDPCRHQLLRHRLRAGGGKARRRFGDRQPDEGSSRPGGPCDECHVRV